MTSTRVAVGLLSIFLFSCQGRESFLPTDPSPPQSTLRQSASSHGGHGWAAGHADLSFEFGTTVVDQFSFIARETPSGRNNGQFEFRAKYQGVTVRAHGRVDCISVVGNKARIGGTVTHTTFPEGIAKDSQLTWSVTDHGEPGAGADTASPLLGAPAEAYCAAGLPYPEFPIARGNIQVR